jgi:hypothetical protein
MLLFLSYIVAASIFLVFLYLYLLHAVFFIISILNLNIVSYDSCYLLLVLIVLLIYASFHDAVSNTSNDRIISE